MKEVILEATTFNLATTLAESGEVLVEGVTLVWQLMIGNPLLTFFLGVSLVSLGFGFFKKAKHTVN